MEKLYSLQHLDLSYNRIVELNETNRIGELPFLEELMLKGNPFCEQRPYRPHVFAHLGERSSLVTLDGEGIGPREKEEVGEIQEKIKQERAKVSTKTLISKKKTKARVADILPPKKKKDKKDVVAEYANSDEELTANGAAVANLLHLDVDKVRAKYGDLSILGSSEGTSEGQLSPDGDPSTPHLSQSPSQSQESVSKWSGSDPAEDSHLMRGNFSFFFSFHVFDFILFLTLLPCGKQSEELAREEDREREKQKEEERAKEKEKERERERERKKQEKEREVARLQEVERQKAKEVSPELARIIDKLRKKEDLAGE